MIEAFGRIEWTEMASITYRIAHYLSTKLSLRELLYHLHNRLWITRSSLGFRRDSNHLPCRTYLVYPPRSEYRSPHLYNRVYISPNNAQTVIKGTDSASIGFSQLLPPMPRPHRHPLTNGASPPPTAHVLCHRASFRLFRQES